MAKSEERNSAVKLRQEGYSIKDIANKLRLSKSTVSVWCRGIELSQVQIQRLHDSMVKGSYVGRIKGSKIQHEKRMMRIEEAEKWSANKISKLSERDLLLALIGLYWGEGSKKNRVLFINNSDPVMIKFIIKGFKKLFNIDNNRFILAVGLNVVHRQREKEIINYWSKITGMPLTQFRKTIFIKTKNKKNYNNFLNHYGTLRINVSKSIDIYYKMIALIKTLSEGI